MKATFPHIIFMQDCFPVIHTSSTRACSSFNPLLDIWPHLIPFTIIAHGISWFPGRHIFVRQQCFHCALDEYYLQVVNDISYEHDDCKDLNNGDILEIPERSSRLCWPKPHY